MASPAPSPAPLGLSESVRAVFAQLETDPKLVGKGLSSAFAASFPDLPAEATGLAATEAARVAVILGVPGIAVMDVTQLASSSAAAPEKVTMLLGLIDALIVTAKRNLAVAAHGYCHIVCPDFVGVTPGIRPYARCHSPTLHTTHRTAPTVYGGA